ncbi:MAG: hypothetical protein WCF90_03350 [Methanomicrobiales archaeon]
MCVLPPVCLGPIPAAGCFEPALPALSREECRIAERSKWWGIIPYLIEWSRANILGNYRQVEAGCNIPVCKNPARGDAGNTAASSGRVGDAQFVVYPAELGGARGGRYSGLHAVSR